MAGIVDAIRTRGWGPIVLEVIVLVVGIGLAFSIDRWWEGIQLRSEEASVLAELREDFEMSRERLLAGAAAYQNAVESGQKTLELLSASSPPPEDSLKTLIPQVFHGSSYDPTLVTIDELKGSGRMGIIKDRDLRRALVEFTTLTDGAFGTLARIDVELWMTRDSPYMSRRFNHQVFRPDQGEAGRDVLPTPPFPTGLQGIEEDMEFWNLVVNKMQISAGRAATMSRMAEICDRVLELIDRAQS